MTGKGEWEWVWVAQLEGWVEGGEERSERRGLGRPAGRRLNINLQVYSGHSELKFV